MLVTLIGWQVNNNLYCKSLFDESKCILLSKNHNKAEKSQSFTFAFNPGNLIQKGNREICKEAFLLDCAFFCNSQQQISERDKKL